ncbi:hypothetical protein RDWZM_009752 [Blomia tropicalis]|uniref:Uncharacterized protein n=1 Tax=Blomia tropicalis TaxID=40697 RepID=A0A9Q0M3M9_BLOTA|nr:hypothetical protein RDWZM_009752 [Blomia tropicalis]
MDQLPPSKLKINNRNRLYRKILNQADRYSEYICGMGAATLSVLVTYPINKIMFRQSLWGFNAADAVRQLRMEGIGYLFRGCMPPIIMKSSTASIMFGAYNQYGNWLRSNPETASLLEGHPLWTSFFASMLGGSTEALLTPFERIQMILQDGRTHNQYRNTMDAFMKLRKYGFGEYYRGMTAVLIRNGPSTFMYFGFKDEVKSWVERHQKNMGQNVSFNNLTNFLTGGILGAFISTIFYPINVVRIQMMIQEVGSPKISIWSSWINLYQERYGKPHLILSGIQLNMVRSILYWGCMTVFAEHFRTGLNRFVQRSNE